VLDAGVLDQLYNLTARKREDYINPTASREFIWQSACSYIDSLFFDYRSFAFCKK